MTDVNGVSLTGDVRVAKRLTLDRVNLNNLPIGRQRYDGLQTRLTKRFSHGFTFVASYVFSKTLEQLTLLTLVALKLPIVAAGNARARCRTFDHKRHLLIPVGLKVAVGIDRLDREISEILAVRGDLDAVGGQAQPGDGAGRLQDV